MKRSEAFSALLFLYREVLHQDLGPTDALRARRPRRLPTVLTKEETLRLIGCLSGAHQLMAKLLYGSGLRLMDCLRLRVKDLDFERRAIIVREGKGGQDRVTVLPDSFIPALQEHLQRVKALHDHGPGPRLWLGLPARCPGAQVPPCRPGVGLAVRVSLQSAIARSSQRGHAPPSSA